MFCYKRDIEIFQSDFDLICQVRSLRSIRLRNLIYLIDSIDELVKQILILEQFNFELFLKELGRGDKLKQSVEQMNFI